MTTQDQKHLGERKYKSFQERPVEVPPLLSKFSLICSKTADASFSCHTKLRDRSRSSSRSRPGIASAGIFHPGLSPHRYGCACYLHLPLKFHFNLQRPSLKNRSRMKEKRLSATGQSILAIQPLRVSVNESIINGFIVPRIHVPLK